MGTEGLLEQDLRLWNDLGAGMNWLLGACGSSCRKHLGKLLGACRKPYRKLLGKLLQKLSIINSRTLPLAPLKE
jgi:hypothetical protein